ncbi:DEAD/DEAH box helicase [Guptibacillus hwajinpoensis]|uniref:DEAD/DEAH box helicase n=1 Tax=Guptibacillus hwajinpoensis TaxID=208199 RepID=UPI003D04C3AB
MNIKYNYLAEVITKNDFNKMLEYKSGITIVAAPTGTGKSTFIIEDLIKPNFHNENHGFGEGIYQKLGKMKILVMANRTAVVLKFNEDVEKACNDMGIYKANGVTVASYQKVTDSRMMKEIDEADLVICDEAHYFISDAWNGTTERITDKILEASENKPVIFFTATPQLIIKYFSDKGISHKEIDYRNVLGFNDRMDFICTNKDLEQIICSIPKDEKALVFVPNMTSKKNLKKWKEKLCKKGYSVDYYHSFWEKDTHGNFGGKTNDDMQSKVSNLVKKKKFDTQIALANNAIDNGIDLKDPELKHIIMLNHYEQVQIQQMIGRKRFDVTNSDDRLTVWFTTEGDNTLNGFYDDLLKRVKLINRYKEHYSENYEATKVGLRHFPASKSKSNEEFEAWVNSTVFSSFFSEVENNTLLEKMKLTPEQIQNDQYTRLLRNQLGFITPLVCKHVKEKSADAEVSLTIEHSNIVRNYQMLVNELFNRTSKVVWRNKDEAKNELEKEQVERVAVELVSYLKSFDGIQLFDDEKQNFQSKIGHYFGAAKRATRYPNLTTVNDFIRPHGFRINDVRQTINQKKKTVWLVKQT